MKADKTQKRSVLAKQALSDIADEMTIIKTDQLQSGSPLVKRLLSIFAVLAGAYILFWPTLGIWLIISNAPRPLFVPLFFYPVAIILGEDPNKRDSSGNTALSLAGYANESTIAEMLIAHGADLSAKDNTGRTPLHCATDSGNVAVAKVFLEGGAHVDVIDSSGRTPLSNAVTSGPKEMVELLLKYGANPNHGNKGCWYPLHRALNAKRLNHKVRYGIVEVLLKYGADSKADNMDNWSDDSGATNPDIVLRPADTPLSIAERKGFDKIAGLLRKH